MAAVNTQFSIAIHLMTGIGMSDGPVTSTELSNSVNAYPSFVRRVLSKLSKAGLVRTTTGKTGACALAKKIGEITLLDIYEAVEPPKAFAIHSYPEKKECQVSCNIKQTMEKVLTKAQRSLEESLKKTTLAEVIRDLGKG